MSALVRRLAIHGAVRDRYRSGHRLTVLLVAPDIETLGGFELQLSLLASGLVTAGHTVDVVVRRPVNSEHPYVRRMRESGVVVNAPSSRLAHLLDPPAALRRESLRVGMLLAAPATLVPAIVDAMIRRRSLRRARHGALGVAHGALSRLTDFDGLTWWLERTLNRLTRHRRPDIFDVQHSMIPAGLKYAEEAGLPVVYTEYGAPDEAMASVWIGLAPLINVADHVIGRAEASIAGLRRLCGLDDAVPFTIVPNAVPSPPDEDLSPDGIGNTRSDDGTTLLVIGRLARSKGTDIALEAFAHIADRYPGLRLVLAGEGPLRAAIERRVAELDLSGRVTVTGVFDEIGTYLLDADIVVHPTFNDGRSVAVLEAMAWGRPVIASEVGGIAELVVDGVTGMLVPPGDIGELAAAIERLLADRNNARRMGAAGRAAFAAGDFSVAAMVNRTIEVYDSVLGRQEPRTMGRLPISAPSPSAIEVSAGDGT